MRARMRLFLQIWLVQICLNFHDDLFFICKILPINPDWHKSSNLVTNRDHAIGPASSRHRYDFNYTGKHAADNTTAEGTAGSNSHFGQIKNQTRPPITCNHCTSKRRRHPSSREHKKNNNMIHKLYCTQEARTAATQQGPAEDTKQSSKRRTTHGHNTQKQRHTAQKARRGILSASMYKYTANS